MPTESPKNQVRLLNGGRAALVLFGLAIGRDVLAVETYWDKRYTSTPSGLITGIDATPDGGAVTVGQMSSATGGQDVWILKTDSAGAVQWRQVLTGPTSDSASAVKYVAGEGYIVSGSSFLAGT